MTVHLNGIFIVCVRYMYTSILCCLLPYRYALDKSRIEYRCENRPGGFYMRHKYEEIAIGEF